MEARLLDAKSVPLHGLHLIEASAGTGKTYNITRLYLRLLLERKLTVEQILVMTFTKDATQELKGRIDDTLREALKNWDTLIVDDEFFQSLSVNIAPQEAKLVLQRALLFIDEAAIFTIHGFCQRVLNQYAFNAKISLDATLSPDMQTPLLQGAQDWYRQLAKADETAFLALAQFWSTPEKFVDNFAKAILQNMPIKRISVDAVKAKFVALVRQAIDDIEQHHALLTEHLIDSKKGKDRETRVQELEALNAWLASILPDFEQAYTTMPASFADGKRYARSKVKAELVEAFSHVKEIKTQQAKLAQHIDKANAYLIVEQGIATIKALMTAEKAQQNVLGFDDLVEKLASCVKDDESLASQLYHDYPVALIDEFQDTDSAQYTIVNEIYRQRDQACVFMIGDPKQAIYGFRGGDVFAYLNAREQCQYQWVMDTNWRSSKGMIQAYNRLFYGNDIDSTPVDVFNFNIDYLPVKPSVKAKAELHCQQAFKPLQIVDFVNDDKVKQSARGQMANWCANEMRRLLDEQSQLSAKDFAVLVRDSLEANQIKQALLAIGLPSVFLSNRDNLFQSKEAQQLLTLLKGIIELENESLYSNALTTLFLGYGPQAFLALQHDELGWQSQKQAFETLRDLWLSQGFMPMALTLLHDHFTLADDNRDRTLTNVLHLFEVLQEASSTQRLPQELLFWFEQQLTSNTAVTEAELRLESDANLIKIVTQHGSKGLEYPVVFVPFATRYKNPLRVGSRQVSLIEYHDEHGGKETSLGGDESQRAAMLVEAHAEAVRLLYVAITRAEQRCYLLTANFDSAATSPLGLTLNMSADDELSAKLAALANEEPTIGYRATEFDLNYVDDYQPINEGNITQEAQVAKFNGKIERDWWLSSFTALSRNMRHQGISAPDRDEVDIDEQVTSQEPNIRFTLTKGAQAGNLLHEMLEYNRFDAPQWLESLAKNQKRFQDIMQETQHGELAEWLDDIVSTPLNHQNAEHFSLGALAHEKTLRECEFYFPMEQAKLSGLIQILTDHRKQNPHRATPYNKQVYLPYVKQLKGMMHGFIDLVFEHEGKYYVCDYKSSHLGDNYQDYQLDNIAEHVETHHYDLQYLIYSLALHRYLSNQLPDYDIAEHFGGVYYLYLRGMTANTGASAVPSPSGQGTGVYTRKIEATELQALDDVFAGKVSDIAKQLTVGG